MTRIDDVRAKKPCPLDILFRIINQIQTDCVEPWYGQIKKLADGADKWASGMHKAVVFGMYPELEDASKEYHRRYKDIYKEFENNPHNNTEHFLESLQKLSLQIGEEYDLNKNRYVFNEMNEEQAKRVQKRKDIEIKNMCNEFAEAMPDPLHIVMQGLSKKLDSRDCKKLMEDFMYVPLIFKFDKENNSKRIELSRKKIPEAYLIYEQVKNCLEAAEIKDCDQTIDAKDYKRFIQTLERFEYNDKTYNLIDEVRPITQKRDSLGNITQIRPNAFSPSQRDK